MPERDVFVCPGWPRDASLQRDPALPSESLLHSQRTCHRCPLKASCSPGRAERSVTRWWDAGLLEEFELYANSRRARRHLRIRKVIVEPISGDSKVKHGVDRACFQAAMLIQALLTASVLNIKQLVHRVPVLHAMPATLAVSLPTPVTACPRLRSSVRLLHRRRASAEPPGDIEADGSRPAVTHSATASLRGCDPVRWAICQGSFRQVD